MAILDNLTCFWSLEETSGNRADSHGSMTLTDNNTVTSNTGKVGTAAEFALATNEYLSHADHDDLEPGDADFTLTCWVYLTTGVGTYPTFISKAAHPNDYGYEIFYVDNEVKIWISPDGTGAALVTAAYAQVMSLNTWYFVCAQYDAGANQVSIAVNNGTPATASETGGVFNGTGVFHIGTRMSGSDSNARMNGRIDQVGFWKRKITADEITWLYNSGNGRTYAEMYGIPVKMAQYRQRWS